MRCCRPWRPREWSPTSRPQAVPTRWSGTAGSGSPGARCSGWRWPAALASDAELLLADDVSSALDSATEIELWAALRERGATVIGATSKRAALAQADRVVVLVEGRLAAVGAWSELSGRWGHLAG